MKKNLLVFVLVLFTIGVVKAQLTTPLFTDGLMMPKKDLGTGVYYGVDSWDHYWEGALKRENGNVGRVTTQVASFMGAYGLSERVSVAVVVPYIWTKASSGVLHGMQGIQDISFMAKYNFLRADLGKSNIKFFGVGHVSTPGSNYNIDLLPLSIGLHSTNVAGRITGQWTYNQNWYLVGSGSYTWRSNVYLDRSSYYTDGQLFFTNEMQMPATFDFIFRGGYKKDMWHAELYYTQINTLGGGDIRRQDMPYASNRMNAQRLGASLMYAAPKLQNVAFRVWGNYALAGRNVGQSYSVMGGVMYFFHFDKTK